MSEYPSAAEVIAQHRKLWSDTIASCSGCDWSRFGNITRTDLAHAAHVLDALREAGWIVEKLPEPTGRWAEGPEWRDFISGAIHAVVWTGDAPGSTVMVQNVEPGSLTPDQAHDLAAALLAAAAAVSQDGDSDA